MPIDYSKYPKDWKRISKQIRFERAKNRCERCNVRNYAIGYWKDELIDGELYESFYYECGNIYWDDFQYTSSYKEAREACDYVNEWRDDQYKRIVIVLTVAHLCNCNPLCANPEHLKALCQRCHLRMDAKSHAENAKRTRTNKKDAERNLLHPLLEA